MKLTKSQISKLKKRQEETKGGWKAEELELIKQMYDEGITNARAIDESGYFPGRSAGGIYAQIRKIERDNAKANKKAT